VIAHPALIAYYSRSPRWRETGPKQFNLKSGNSPHRGLKKKQQQIRRLGLRSFEYTAPAREQTA